MQCKYDSRCDAPAKVLLRHHLNHGLQYNMLYSEPAQHQNTSVVTFKRHRINLIHITIHQLSANIKNEAFLKQSYCLVKTKSTEYCHNIQPVNKYMDIVSK